MKNELFPFSSRDKFKIRQLSAKRAETFPLEKMYVCVKVNRTILKIITPNRSDVSKDTQQKRDQTPFFLFGIILCFNLEQTS